MNKQNFALPNLCEPLATLAPNLQDGRGFFTVRGLEHGKYSEEDNTLLFLGLSLYVGDKRAIQDENGHIFGELICPRRNENS
jgi:hypothetical protein